MVFFTDFFWEKDSIQESKNMKNAPITHPNKIPHRVPTDRGYTQIVCKMGFTHG